MAEITLIQIQTTAPTRGYPAGVVATAFYKVEDKTVTLTDQDGKTLHDPEGKEYTRVLAENDDARQVAGRLLRDFRTKMRGDKVSGFDRPLLYSRAQRVPY